MFSLSGKTAFVAGASRGIGLAIARDLAVAGAHTILASRSREQLEIETKTIRDDGYSAEWRHLDVTDSASIHGAIVSLSVDILVNVAGMNLRKPFEKYTMQEYDRILQTNLNGLVELTQGIGKSMIARGRGGKIVNIGSLTSLVGLPYVSVYAITKGALGQLTRALAAEWGRYDIQVNCIAPGFILTDLNRDMWESAEMKQWLSGAQPIQRLGNPQDVSPLVVFLASQGSNYVTGQIIAVDGGYSTTSVWPYRPAEE